jgi:hypothetical protein
MALMSLLTIKLLGESAKGLDSNWRWKFQRLVNVAVEEAHI